MRNLKDFPNISVVFLIIAFAPSSDSVRGCTVMLQSETSNFKVAICNDPLTNLRNVPRDIPVNTVKLEIMYQNITTLPPNEFNHIYQLEYLTLNSCGIRYISPTAFENLNQLKVLALSNNSLVIHETNNLQSEIFQPLGSLGILDLSYNFIQIIPRHFFKYLEKTLRVLVLSNSKSLFTIFPDSLSDLIRLERLDISQNNLIQLDSGFEVVFNKMISLQNLIIHGNPWKCDCKMRWLVYWYQHSTLSAYPAESISQYNFPSAVCHSPRSMRNAKLLRPISSQIKDNEFPCFPKCLTKSMQLDVIKGNNISLPCIFQSNDQKRKIHWSHNGTKVRETSRDYIIQMFERDFKSVLSIINFTYNLSGTWSCYILFDDHVIGANFSIFYKFYGPNDKQFYMKGSSTINTTKTVTLTLIGSVTLLFLLSIFMGLIYRYVYHFKPRKRIIKNQKYLSKSNEVSWDRHNLIYNRLQENPNWNSESLEFWNLRSSEMDDEKSFVNSSVLKNPTILTSLSTDGFVVSCLNNEITSSDSHVFVNAYIESPVTLITRTPSTTPCPIHEAIASLESSKNDSLTNSTYQPCPLHGDMLSVLLQSPSSQS